MMYEHRDVPKFQVMQALNSHIKQYDSAEAHAEARRLETDAETRRLGAYIAGKAVTGESGTRKFERGGVISYVC